jgi:hypothetical protein
MGDGYPSGYQERPTLLNFGDPSETGVFNGLASLAKARCNTYIIGGVYEEDILWLEICMCQLVIV